MNEYISSIIKTNKKLADFWSNSHGWAPLEAAELLSKSMLTWQVELSECLRIWEFKKKLTDGELILAWVNLGSLVEGSMKLFMSVYLSEYQNMDDKKKFKKFNKTKLPDEISFEWLKQFLIEDYLFAEYEAFFNTIQKNRNAIHSFKGQTIDSQQTYNNCLVNYASFLEEMDSRLPYPSDAYRQER